MTFRDISLGPWLWGPRVDLAAFAGSATLALGLVAVGHWLGFAGGELPEWGWVLFVLLIDVGHVYSTLFRTYFDRYEVRRHLGRYLGLPVLLYAGGVLLYQAGELWFWRTLAYIALFHFVRQQVGWAALYRAKARLPLADKLIDEAAIYGSTLYPVVYWHANLDWTRFHWFVEGDFVDLAIWAGLEPIALTWWVLALAVFFFRQVEHFRRRRTLHLGRVTIVVTTAATWYVGIVGTNSDFDFTVTNVIAHGVPYVVLLWSYARARARQGTVTLAGNVSAMGLTTFLGVLALLAYAEEWAWSGWVYADHSWLFPFSPAPASESVRAWLVPLLALPQLTHYALDGVLWRRRDTAQSDAQRIALGFAVRGGRTF